MFRLLIGMFLLLAASPLLAHTIEGSDAAFVENIDGPAIGPFIYLGAKHMVTGYDHLLFLVGVVFFLYRPGHSALSCCRPREALIKSELPAAHGCAAEFDGASH